MKKKQKFIFENGIEVICKNTRDLKKLAGNNLLFYRADSNLDSKILKKSINIRFK